MDNRIFGEGVKAVVSREPGVAMPLPLFAFCPNGLAVAGQWAEVYRIAYERSVEALRPTRYDRALRGSAN